MFINFGVKSIYIITIGTVIKKKIASFWKNSFTVAFPVHEPARHVLLTE